MVTYTLTGIANLLPYDMKYNIMLVQDDGKEEHHFNRLSWSEMRNMLTRPWWRDNVELYNMAMNRQDEMILHLEKSNKHT